MVISRQLAVTAGVSVLVGIAVGAGATQQAKVINQLSNPAGYADERSANEAYELREESHYAAAEEKMDAQAVRVEQQSRISEIGSLVRQRPGIDADFSECEGLSRARLNDCIHRVLGWEP